MKQAPLAAFACMAAFASASSAAARDPLLLQPTSQWRLHRDEDKCRLVRTFGTGEQQVVLMLHQSGPQPAFNVSLVGKPMANPYGTRIGITFLPAGAEKVRGYLASTRGARLPFVFLHGVSLGDPGGATTRQATALTVSRALPGPVTLETGPLADQVERMHACAAELAQSLGLDRLGQAAHARSPAPVGNPGNWMTSADYPRRALHTRTEGVVPFRLTIDKHGKPTSCHIVGSEEPDLFEDSVCLKMLQRASFKPALDPDGKPVAAYWQSAVRFEIGG